MKNLFATLLLVLALMLTPVAQQGSLKVRSKAKNNTQSPTNRPPAIASFTTSSPTITIPCPRWVEGAYCVALLSLDITTEALDPDGDSLNYKYFVSGGQIVGQGAKVRWNLTGMNSGSYEVKVQVGDQRGGYALRSANVSLLERGHCPLPCALVSVSCPDDLREKQLVTFTASLSGGEPTVIPTYKWTVSAGTILSGQGTSSIQIDTSGMGEQQVTATVEIGGYPPECQSKAFCSVRVRKNETMHR